jgi:hypothetical protein
MHLGAVSGYVSWIGKVAERNASLTEILIESGAVLYVRTNVPQTLMVRFTFSSEFFPVFLTLIFSGRKPTTSCSVGQLTPSIAP